jgi:uncharacterized protein involved in outer membrane biogenesis
LIVALHYIRENYGVNLMAIHRIGSWKLDRGGGSLTPARKRFMGGVALGSIAVVVFAALSVNFFVRRNKDYLIGRMEQALQRKISTDEVEVALWPVGVRFGNFAALDDPAFSAGSFLRAKELRIELRPLPLLLGRLRLKRIVLQAPAVTILRDAAGRYNFARRAGGGERDRDGVDGREKASAEKRDAEMIWVPWLTVFDGTLHYRDLKSGRELTATQINLKIFDFEWNEPFEVHLEAAVMAAERNLRLKVRGGPIAGNWDYRDIPFEGGIQADALDLGKVTAALPQFRKALPGALRFDGIYTIKDLEFKGTLNTLSLKGTVRGTDASFRFE